MPGAGGGYSCLDRQDQRFHSQAMLRRTAQTRLRIVLITPAFVDKEIIAEVVFAPEAGRGFKTVAVFDELAAPARQRD